MIIAIDGTFASGKGTLAKALAAHYGYHYLDTGKLYRAVARDVLAAGPDSNPDNDPDNAQAASRAAKHIDRQSLNDPALKSGVIGAAASKVAVHADVRAALLEFQHSFAAQAPGAVLDGRDIGTVICPQAEVKLYIDAAPDERARRRHAELLGYGEDISLATVAAQLAERDGRDSGRALAPLKPAADAHLIDTTDMTVEAVLQTAIGIVEAVLSA